MRTSVVPDTKCQYGTHRGELKELYSWQVSVAELVPMREASTAIYTVYRTRWVVGRPKIQ